MALKKIEISTSGDSSWLKGISIPKQLTIAFGIIFLALLIYHIAFKPDFGQIEAIARKEVMAVAMPLSRKALHKPKKISTKVDPVVDLGELKEEPSYIYSSVGKRDPFMPFNFAPQKNVEDSAKTPLEKYTLSQLKLTAILLGLGQPKAIVENAAGRGFTVTVGTKIGRNGGVVTSIGKESIIVHEVYVDFTGAKKEKDIELRLRAKKSDDYQG